MCGIIYKSKTEVRLAKIKSLRRSQKASIKYNTKLAPKEKKLLYIKNKRTGLARIPRRSANREQTLYPWRSSWWRTWCAILIPQIY